MNQKVFTADKEVSRNRITKKKKKKSPRSAQLKDEGYQSQKHFQSSVTTSLCGIWQHGP